MQKVCLYLTLVILCLLIPVGHAAATDFNVASADDIADAMDLAQPGDVLIMADGIWVNQSIDFEGFGTAANPITLRAQTPGGVTLTGQSNLSISGDYLVVDGLNFEGGTPGSASSVIQFRGSNGNATNSRLTNTQIKDYNPSDINDRYFWVSLYGQNNRVDHSRFENQNHSGVTVVAWLDGGAANHMIDANHFVDRPEGNGNGFETIRLGTSAFGNTNANIVVENNLFERTDGEIEIISNKSNDNTFQYNTFLESAGTLTLRHGHRATVAGNFFLGQDKADSGGVRVIGEDHLIVNNYFADLDDRAEGAISLTAGIDNTPANGYQQVKNASIVNNTIVNVQGAAITFDWLYDANDQDQLAENVLIANNLISSDNAPLFVGQEGSGWTWQNNIAHGTTLGISSRAGILEVDPLLVMGADGLWRPASNSPAIDGGAAFAPVTVDMDGQARIGILDIGADEVSTAQIVRKPLTAGDVGTNWDTTGPPAPTGNRLVIEAEDFSQITDPNGDGEVWTLINETSAFGGQAIEAPSGSRTNLPGTHDTLAIYDLVFDQADTYTVYYRARGFSGSTNSLYVPDDFDTEPDITTSTSTDSVFDWITGETFVLDSAHVGMPLEFRLGRREGLTQLDAIIFHVQGDLTDAELNLIMTAPPFVLGDMDGDLLVDEHDLAIILNNFGAAVTAGSLADGDATGDGLVSILDLNVVLTHWTGSSPPSLTVPEPSTLVLSFFTLALVMNRRR